MHLQLGPLPYVWNILNINSGTILYHWPYAIKLPDWQVPVSVTLPELNFTEEVGFFWWIEQHDADDGSMIDTLQDVHCC